jgi:hypothetical protein
MAIRKCVAGRHVYDDSQYDTCPYCRSNPSKFSGALSIDTVVGDYLIQSVVTKEDVGFYYDASNIKTDDQFIIKEFFPYFAHRSNDGKTVVLNNDISFEEIECKLRESVGHYKEKSEFLFLNENNTGYLIIKKSTGGIQRCNSGEHIFDSSQYSSCPYCRKTRCVTQSGGGTTSRSSSRSSSTRRGSRHSTMARNP